MTRKLRPRSIYDVFAVLALVVAMGGTGAYAANTVFSSDIVDGEVKSVDIANNSIHSGDILDNTINTFDVHSFLGVDVVDNSLTGADIDESSLNLPQNPTTTTFAGGGPVSLGTADTFVKIASKNLPAGSWAVVATANTSISNLASFAVPHEAVCELRNGTGFIGGATDRRLVPGSDSGPAKRTLSMNGGAQVPAGGGEVSLWCKSDYFNEQVTYSQMMMTRLDGFS